MSVAHVGSHVRFSHRFAHQFAWPFRLVRVDDDRRRGRQGLLRRGRGLGHAGRVDAWRGLYPVYRRRQLGKRADGPAGGREETGLRPSWLGYVGVNDVDATADRIKRLGGAMHVPPTDIPNISRFSRRRRPANGNDRVVQVAETRPSSSPPSWSTPGRVGWHELLAADWEKALAFYGELFGWQKADADTGAMGTYQLFSAGGQTIGGMFTKPEGAGALLALLLQRRRHRRGDEAREGAVAADPRAARSKCRAAAGWSNARTLRAPFSRWWESAATTVSDISSAPHRASRSDARFGLRRR